MSEQAVTDTAFGEIVALIAAARQRAVQAVNSQIIDLYWQVGATISRKIAAAEWGDGVIPQLAAYLAKTQPGLRGFTRTNLFRMRQFYETYRDHPSSPTPIVAALPRQLPTPTEKGPAAGFHAGVPDAQSQIVAALLRQLPWTHHLIILGQCKRPEEREFYLRMAIRERWSSRELERQLKGALFERTVIHPPKASQAVQKNHAAALAVFKESGPEPFSENSLVLNPKLNKREIRKAFEGPEYQILLVANKFQTGFDQPLLCGMYVDRRLAGIQAVQTLSRLNRARKGKDQTYVVDFVNDPEEILAAFKTYHATAELAAATDPNIVFNLRAKLDATGYYDDFEVDRVVAVELRPDATQAELERAIDPVADRLMKGYKAAQERLRTAKDIHDEAAAKEAREEQAALTLFKSDMGAFVRLYTFLSQIFDYGNTAIEKRAIFYKQLMRVLDFGREREGIDLSKVVLTHHHLRNLGKRTLPLQVGEQPKLDPIKESGSGMAREPERAFMNEIIAKLNELFGEDTTDNDHLTYVDHVLMGKLKESEVLQEQAANNSEEQFGTSPDLRKEVVNAAMDAQDAHLSMSNKLLNSPEVLDAVLAILLKRGLWKVLRGLEATAP